jgi:hypothetical protein
MFSYWAYVLIGKNDTGKTSFQKHLLWHLCERRPKRLQVNIVEHIVHPLAPKSLETLFVCNRSYQELRSRYKSVDNYFRNFFRDANICTLSTHTHGKSIDDADAMIRNLKSRRYNVAGVFWSNSFDDDARKIACLSWTELLWIENPKVRGEEEIKVQLERIALHFSQFLLARARIQ